MNLFFRKKAVLFFIIISALAFGCKKEQPEPINNQPVTEEGTLEVKFLTRTSEGAFELGIPFSIGNNRKAMAEELKFYVQHLDAIREDGQPVRIKDVALLDFAKSNKNSHGDNGITLALKVPPGKYKGVRFRVGLDSLTNFSDPTRLSAESPLSVQTGMYWSWSTGYRFFVMEGKVDASPAGGTAPSAPFAYHTGTQELAFMTDFSDRAEYAFEVKKGNYTHFNVELRADHLFSNESDTIDVRNPNNLFTHSMPNQMPLARKFNEQIKRAMKAYGEE